MGGTSQVKAMCLGGNWEVQARYMRGTCDIKATSRRRKKDECRMQKGEGAKQGAVRMGRALAQMGRKETGRAQGSPVSEAGPSRFGDGSGLAGLFGEGVDHLDLRLFGGIHDFDDDAKRGSGVGADGEFHVGAFGGLG